MGSMHSRKTLVFSVSVFVILALTGCAAPVSSRSEHTSQRRGTSGRGTANLEIYRGLGTWIDVYGPWKHVQRQVRKMQSNGVRTLYLETSSFKQPRAILYPGAVGRYIEAAHAAGIEVVAWYNPSFRRLRRDWRRVKRAISFRSPGGQRFDSFALDIEATVVKDIDRRNRRMLRLSDRIRDFVGPSYTLGAIIPDPTGSTYWLGFPYKRVARRYDVWLPMSYFTYRANGYQGVYRFVSANIRAIRRLTGDPGAPVHVIGGIAGVGSTREVRAFLKAVARRKAFGASLYDFPLTTRTEWRRLQAMDTKITSR